MRMPAQANRGEAREAGAARAGADLPALLHDWAIVLALVVAILWPACRWYAEFKRRHHSWWLSYV